MKIKKHIRIEHVSVRWMIYTEFSEVSNRLMSHRIKIGEGTVLGDYLKLGKDVVIGSNVVIGDWCCLSAGTKIEDNSVLPKGYNV